MKLAKLLPNISCLDCDFPIVQTEPQFDKDFAIYCSSYDCRNHVPTDILENQWPDWVGIKKAKPRRK